uniref:Uncharacterized protein n=1 Tax=viral metagenome TaxID=1070528 RepID=A0A6M3JAL5_9ZZZZ
MCDLIKKLFGGGTVEQPSPSNIIPAENIHKIGNPLRLEINLWNINIPWDDSQVGLWYPSIPNSNSMDPIYDEGHNVSYLKPGSKANHIIMCDWLEAEILMGFRNIAVYFVDATLSITHYAFAVGHDAEGRYFRFKGFNNSQPDPYKVRDNQLMCIGFNITY